MKLSIVIKWLVTIAKFLGIVSVFNQIPFISPGAGVVVCLIASLAKDFLLNVADLLDDGKINKSIAFLIFFAFLIVSTGAGCAGMGSIAHALAKDQASFVLRMGTPWGNQQITRIGGQTNSVVVSPDGSISINAPR